MNRILKAIACATLLAGTLDILSAFVFSGLTGSTPVDVLNSVAQGPFAQRFSGLTGAGVGLAVHFLLMTVMATVLVMAMARVPALGRNVWLTGLVYGLILYGVMYWIVLPARWPTIFPQTDPVRVIQALVSHIACAGLPLAWAARRVLAQP
jgi:hypothetical protein